jgi:hypothetical protein
MRQGEQDMSEQERQPAGWYKDPWDAAPARWWDGAQWTADVASLKNGVAMPEPLRDIPTGTVWIWLIVLLPLISLAFTIAGDPVVELEAISVPPGPGSTYVPRVLTLDDVVNLAIYPVTIVLAYVDSRTLRNRGVHRPFGWGWTFLLSGIYVIGRGVVVRRQTGRGLGPVWAWIAVTVVTLVVLATYFFIALNTFLRSELGTIALA